MIICLFKNISAFLYRTHVIIKTDIENDMTMRKPLSHRRMIIGSRMWQLKNKILSRWEK